MERENLRGPPEAPDGRFYLFFIDAGGGECYNEANRIKAV